MNILMLKEDNSIQMDMLSVLIKCIFCKKVIVIK